MTSEHKTASARFGTVLGVGPGGVPVHSSDYASADKAELPTRQHYRSYVDGIFMGYKWQCVELARRWLYLNKGYIFDDIAMAYDIFRLRWVRRVADGERLPLRSFRNGAKRPPEPGCLLIWNEGGEFEVTGHVAVVTEVFPDRLRCIEQNVDNRVWPEGRDYSRELEARTLDDGSYFVQCQYHGAEILGWVIQTGDDTHAEIIEDPDPRLFDLTLNEAPRNGQAARVWLDTGDAAEAAYMKMMGGSRLSGRDEDQYTYFRIGETAYRELKRATNELHAMFLRATGYVLDDADLLRKFNLPPALWPRIHQSWDNRSNEMITGRFDFSLSHRGLKVYEYNADSASCHMECGRVQAKWAAHFGVQEGDCSGETLTADLVAAWRKAGVEDLLHILRDDDPEEAYHALYMQEAIAKAGLRSKIIVGFEGLGWDDDGCVVDADGERIDFVWKTWAWETALDQLRAECDEDDENIRLNHVIDRRKSKPRLIDVLLRKDVMVYEPLWTLIPSNKAILPVLWTLYPNHPYLLNTQEQPTDEFRSKGYVAKPIVGRCGHNIALFDGNHGLITETGGRFDDRDQVYQELFPLPNLGGMNVQVCTFSVAGHFGGACVRCDASPIIVNHSDVLALRVVDDYELVK